MAASVALVGWGGGALADTGMQGEKDLCKLPLSDLLSVKTNGTAFGRSVNLIVGVAWKINNTHMFRANGWSVLGWVDSDLNKRNQFLRAGLYQPLSPAVSKSLEIGFRRQM